MDNRLVTVSVQMAASAVPESRYLWTLLGQVPRDIKVCATRIENIATSESPTDQDGAELAALVDQLRQHADAAGQIIICLHAILQHAIISDPEGRTGRLQ